MKTSLKIYWPYLIKLTLMLVDIIIADGCLDCNSVCFEMAADPDDKHMPASVRTAYRCEKDPTGDLNRH